jgi:hypothetical protein
MQIQLIDLAYLAKVYDAVKSDNPPKLSKICPECDTAPDPDDGDHVTLSTHIPPYWLERGDWPETNPYGMEGYDQPYVLIGCEGYHLVQF